MRGQLIDCRREKDDALRKSTSSLQKERHVTASESLMMGKDIADLHLAFYDALVLEHTTEISESHALNWIDVHKQLISIFKYVYRTVAEDLHNFPRQLDNQMLRY